MAAFGSRRFHRRMIESVYLHVPFCAKKCEYCAFYSEGTDGARIERYVQSLLSEIKSVATLAAPKTVFFGGGTPSLLKLDQWRRIFKVFHEVSWDQAAEFTIECNPATVSPAKAGLFREHGVNRVSMGVQSLNEGLLERLGRVHTRDMVFRSYQTLRDAGFENINLDLMFAIPGQTMEMWRQTLAEILELQSDHLSCYEVIYEQDTPLFEQMQAGEFDVDEAVASEMYEVLVQTLEQEGFEQYEIANFARKIPGKSEDIPTRACRHNVNYWVGGEYLGLGPAAAGHVAGERYQNWSNTDLYCEAIEKGRLPRDSGERLNGLAKASETAAFSLRMNRGIDLASFQTRTGFEFQEAWQSESQQLVDQGWGEYVDGTFRLTRQGFRFADAAAAELLKP